MVKILNNILVLIDANVEKDESNKTFMIQLTFRNLDYKIINQTLTISKSGKVLRP